MINRRIASRVLSILFAVMPVTVWSPGLHAADPQEPFRKRVDRLVQPYLDNQILVGATIGVLHEGQEEIFGYGRMSQADCRVPDGNSVYEIGSITKVFTGVLLADAVLRGDARLDQPAAKLLPDGVTMPVHDKRAITLLDLSTHVSGLPRLPANLKMTDPNNPYVDYTVENLYAFLSSHELARAPGEKGLYSNLGQGLLGHLLARRADTTYEQLLRDRITTPLGMTDTSITLDKQHRSRLVPPHRGDGRPAFNWDIPTLAGAGAIRGTVGDMLRFAKANLDSPPGELGEAIDLAWKVHKKPLAKGEFAMGLGWHVARDGTTRWHNGQTGGYHTMLLVSRKFQTSVVVFSNTATGEVDRLAQDIFRMTVGEKIEPRTFEK